MEMPKSAHELLEHLFVVVNHAVAEADEVRPADRDSAVILRDITVVRRDEVGVVRQRRIAANTGDVLHSPLCGQAVVVPSDRIEDVLAAHPLEAGDGVGVGVAEHVADVQRATGSWRGRVDRRTPRRGPTSDRIGRCLRPPIAASSAPRCRRATACRGCSTSSQPWSAKAIDHPGSSCGVFLATQVGVRHSTPTLWSVWVHPGGRQTLHGSVVWRSAACTRSVQSIDSVETPLDCISLRCAASATGGRSCADLGQPLLELAAQVRGQCRAGSTGTDSDRDGAIARDRRQGEGAVGWVVGRVHPDPPVRRVGGDSSVDRRVVGGGDHQTDVVEITHLVPSNDDANVEIANRVGHRRGHDRDLGTPLDQAFDLSQGHPSTTHYQHGYAGQVEHDGVVERHSERLPTINCLKVDRISRN